MAKQFSLASSFVASALVHFVGLALAVALLSHRSYRYEQNLIPVSLLEPEPEDNAVQPLKEQPKAERTKQPPAPIKREIARTEKSAPPPAENEASKANKTETSPQPTPLDSIRETAAAEGGGSAAGVNKLAGRDFGVAPGSGNARSGGGTAIAGLGRGSGAPGLPAQTPLRTSREAKPIQTARASYQPMALRMGLEGDVTLRIEIDPSGKVMKAEIVKSAGAGFDEEALKAVTQSRFEPEQKDGQNVAAEFTYVYRFRLQR